MRLLITLVWCVAALCWLPWFAVLLRLLLALMGWGDWQDYLRPALVGLYPAIGFGWWPPTRWLAWSLASLYPVAALIGIALSALGWRVYRWEQDGILSRPGWLVGLSIIVPPLAPLIMWADARRRYRLKEADLQGEVDDARARLAP